MNLRKFSYFIMLVCFGKYYKMFSCDFCSYSSDKTINLKRHIKRNHSSSSFGEQSGGNYMNEKYGGSYDGVENYCKRHADQQLGIQQPSYKTSLPAPAYRQPLFIKPSFQQQHALPQEAQHLTLPQPLQYPALPQPQQVLDPSPQYPAQPPQYP